MSKATYPTGYDKTTYEEAVKRKNKVDFSKRIKSTERNGLDPKLRKTKGGKSMSPSKFLHGIKAGRIQARVTGYYDNIREIDPDFALANPDFFKDPYFMNRLELISHEQKLVQFIQNHNTETNGQSINSGGSPETTETSGGGE